ncbi:WecB/TagA/CpsF family glycosyltransferase [Novosphingobium guangzhouense]|uniref:Glycosyl transferase n=1 Tax=Novosphingobium guangzhouense TaxID=1850347 RepID=A0A2K2G021_9SPHN|nr:WecB/TagA/CpsF family glycosyltransferase [Novosphingobium guangzhouense]PNU04348.1 glycosyl transferase [Novosphingobium guangzhouense]
MSLEHLNLAGHEIAMPQLVPELGLPLDALADLDAGHRAAHPYEVEFLDLDFTPIDLPAAMAVVCQRPASAPFTYIVTPNVDHVVRLLRRRSDLWPAYRDAWMTLCDSRILARLARGDGRSLPVVTGSDLTLRLFEQGIAPDDTVAILGGSDGTVARLKTLYGLRDVRHYNPPMGFINDPREVARAVRFVVEAKARYSFLAVGSPQQEIIARRVFRARGAQGIGFCVGASLEFLSGEQERAPVMIQQMSMEWAFRLCSNPQRLWRRYLIEGPQIFRIHQMWRNSRAPIPARTPLNA